MTRSTSPSPPRPRPPSGFVAPKGPGTLYLQVVATDSLGAATTGTVTVNVLANQPPVITNGASQTINNIKVNQAAVQLNGTATDPDNAAPSANQTAELLVVAGRRHWATPLTLLDPDTVALSSQTAANPTFTAPDHPATLHFKVAVSDSYDTTVGTVTVNVVGSLAPTANAGPDQTVGHQVVTLDGSGSTDPDVGETATHLRLDPGRRRSARRSTRATRSTSRCPARPPRSRRSPPRWWPHRRCSTSRWS